VTYAEPISAKTSENPPHCHVPLKNKAHQLLEALDGGHEQLISNGGRFKPAFSERNKKQTIIDLRGISTNWFKNQLCPSIRLSIGYRLGEGAFWGVRMRIRV
jgi:hypothetical protein